VKLIDFLQKLKTSPIDAFDAIKSCNLQKKPFES